MIPRTTQDITAEWIQGAFAGGGTHDIPEISDVTLEDIGTGAGQVAQVLRCHLEYRDPDAAGPKSVIVKRPSPRAMARRVARTLSLYEREYIFYRELSSLIPLRSPALFHGDIESRGERFVLVLEDLRDMKNIEQSVGADAERAKLAIRSVAAMHGQFWGKTESLSVSGHYDLFSRKYSRLLHIIYATNLAPTMVRFGHLFPDPMRRLAESFLERVAGYGRELAESPKTFIHGDYRLDNMFFGAGDDGEFAIIDWQGGGIATGLNDVAYFFSSSVTSEVRRQVEREALEEYHDIVCRLGAREFSFADCWRLYRRCMLGCLILVSILGALDVSIERNRRLGEAILTRTLTALEDLDADEFLPDRSRRLSGAAAALLSRCVYRAHRAWLRTR